MLTFICPGILLFNENERKRNREGEGEEESKEADGEKTVESLTLLHCMFAKEHACLPSAGYEDESSDIDMPKTKEGIPQNDDFNLLYKSKYGMEVSADEQSRPASQIQRRHEAHDKNKQKNSLPQTSAENKKPSRKRKYMDTVSLETNIRKSKDSIRKLESHTNNKTCPKSFQYSARANIPPDDIFLKEIKEIKEQAEQGFVSALTRYHKRRLDSQESKLKKAKFFKNSSKSANTDVNMSTREQSHSANTENIVNYDVNKVEKLQQDFNELKEILYTHVLQTSANNKDVEKYKSLFPENQTTAKGPKKSTGFNANIRRKQRRAHLAKKRIATQRQSNKRFIKKSLQSPSY